MKRRPGKPARVQDEDEDEDDLGRLMPNHASLAVQDVDDFTESEETDTVLPAASPVVEVEARAEGPLFSATYTRRRKQQRMRGVSAGGGVRAPIARKALYDRRVGEAGKKNSLPGGEQLFFGVAEAGRKNVLQEVQNFFDNRPERNEQRKLALKVRSRRSLSKANRKSTKSDLQISFDADENEVAGWDTERLMEEDDRASGEFCFQTKKSALPAAETGDVLHAEGFRADQPEQSSRPAARVPEAGGFGGPQGFHGKMAGSDMEFAVRLPPGNSTSKTLRASEFMDAQADGRIPLPPERLNISMNLRSSHQRLAEQQASGLAAGNEAGRDQDDSDIVAIFNSKTLRRSLESAFEEPDTELMEDVGDSNDPSVILSPANDVADIEELQVDQAVADDNEPHEDIHAEPALSPVHTASQVGTVASERHILDGTGISLSHADELVELQDVIEDGRGISLSPAHGLAELQDVIEDGTGFLPLPASEFAELQNVPERNATANDAEQTHSSIKSQPDRGSSTGKRKGTQADRRKRKNGRRQKNVPDVNTASANFTEQSNQRSSGDQPGRSKSAEIRKEVDRRESLVGAGPMCEDGRENETDEGAGFNDYIEQIHPSNDRQPEKSKPRAKRRRMEVDRRKSLIGAGTKWKDGVRRSTRIRLPPVQWWNNEKLLYARVSETLCTLVGIKKLLPDTPPVGRRHKDKSQKFEIKSFVSPKWQNFVNYAAL